MIRDGILDKEISDALKRVYNDAAAERVPVSIMAELAKLEAITRRPK